MNIGPIGSFNSINSVWDNYCKKISPSQNVRKASEVGLPAQSFADIFAEELRKNYIPVKSAFDVTKESILENRKYIGMILRYQDSGTYSDSGTTTDYDAVGIRFDGCA